MYNYDAEIVRWVDGDTVWLRVDLGFRMRTTTDFRLYGIDTPERGRPGYMDAIAAVNDWAPVGTTVRIQTYPDPDKYGRWLVSIDLPLQPDPSSTGAPYTVNNRLIDRGLAKPYFGGHK